MKVAGFTIARNAVKFDYPIVESITSILPIVDHFFVAVGKSEDNTRALIQQIDPNKITIIDTVWDETLREGGRVLADETNKAFDAIPKEFDWCFYLQADEVIHEKYHPAILNGMKQNLADQKVEGLLFHYTHFFGSYDYFGDSRKWYRKEIRIIRNDKAIRSYKDAQSFRKKGEKLKVAQLNARVFHYGWVKHPKVQQEKQKHFNKLWHDDDWVEQNAGMQDEFDYHRIDSLAKFEGTHPRVMKERIARANWKFNPDLKRKNFKFRYRILQWIEKLTGWRIGEFKNYKRIK